MSTTTNASTYADIENVYFYYTKIAEPQQKFGSDDPLDTLYSVQVFLDEDSFDAFTAQFPNKRTTPIRNEEFVEKFKTEVPFPEQKKQYFLRFTQKAFKKDGQPMPESLRPRVFKFTEGRQEDITDTLIGNGSKGTVRYNVWTPKAPPGVTPKPTPALYALLVTDLVRYEKKAYVDPKSFA